MSSPLTSASPTTRCGRRRRSRRLGSSARLGPVRQRSREPATVYAIAPDAESAGCRRHTPPVLSALSSRSPSVCRRVTSTTSFATPEDAWGGRSRRSSFAGDTRPRVAALLTSLGAEMDVERTADGYQLKGYARPLAAAVRRRAARVSRHRGARVGTGWRAGARMLRLIGLVRAVAFALARSA